MNDTSRRCDTHPDLTSFKYGLPHLKAALHSNRKVRIVAIGSSSTAGVTPVLPFPPRLEMLLRKNFFGQMIDVVNRGIGGQEAPEELDRFQADVIDEKPALVIWQVGTNAVWQPGHDLEKVAKAIKDGLEQLASEAADVVLMDLQHVPALLTDDKIAATRRMLSLIDE